METSNNKTVPYSDLSYATEPTAITKFFRTFIPLQVIRFFTLNFKIIKIVVGGHS